MAVFKWTLFGNTIEEETDVDSFLDEREVPNHWRLEDEIAKNDEAPAQENDEYAISDAVLETYYVATFREIYKQQDHVQGQYEQAWQERLKGLNEADKLLNLCVRHGKALVLSWEKRCAKIPQQGNEKLEHAVVRYAEEVWRCILWRTKENRAEIKEGLAKLSETILNNVRVPEGDDQDDSAKWSLRWFLDHLNLLAVQPQRNAKIQKEIRARLCDLPGYLGTPYAERCEFYKEVRRYKWIVREKRDFTPLGAIHMMMFDSEFKKYSADSCQKAADWIANVQKQSCYENIELNALNTLVWNEICDDLRRYLSNMGVLIEAYVDGTRCVAIIDVTLRSGERQYLCFSGVFDSPDPNIQTRFDYADPRLPQNKNISKLKEKIQEIAESMQRNTLWRSMQPELVTANENIRYYYDETDAKKNVTLKQVFQKRKGSLRGQVRMFSCCERKFFTKLETFPSSEVKECEIYVKYEPCGMCVPAIEDFEQKGYQLDIIPGEGPDEDDEDEEKKKRHEEKKKRDKEYKKRYDQLAREVAGY